MMGAGFGGCTINLVQAGQEEAFVQGMAPAFAKIGKTRRSTVAPPWRYGAAVMEPRQYPHRRFNPLTGEWVLVSPHRLQRPWQGKVERLPEDRRPQYDPNCYLCPGNARAGSAHNPAYQGTFVFDNDFAALLPRPPPFRRGEPAFRSEGEPGRCQVVCFSPRHDLSLPELSVAEIASVIRTWTDQTRLLLEDPVLPTFRFREQGRADGLLQPASPQSDLGHVPRAQRSREGTRTSTLIPRAPRFLAAARLSGARATAQPAHRVRQ